MQANDVLASKSSMDSHFVELSGGDELGIIVSAAIKQTQHILCANNGKQIRLGIAVDRR